MISSLKYRLKAVLDNLKPWLVHVKYARLRKPKHDNSLLILKTDAIGDYVLFRNFLEDIRRSSTYRNYHITLCGNVLWKDLALEFDAHIVDDFIWVDPAKLDNETYKNGIIRQLYLLAPTVAIYAAYSRTASGDELITCSGATQKITFSGDCRNMHPHVKARHDKRYTQLIQIKGTLAFEFLRYKEFFTTLLNTHDLHEKPVIKNIRKTNTNEAYIVLCPGASNPSRCWSPHKFHELAQHIMRSSKTAYKFHICGSLGDRALAASIISMQPALSYIDQTGKLNLVEFAQLLANASLVIANDSGPLHLAAACGAKVIGLSNGNNYARFVPYPQELRMPVHVIFPESIRQYTNTEEGIYTMQQQDSPLSINDITVEQAIEVLNTLNIIY